MKKIILLCLVFKALNLHGIWSSFLTNYKYPYLTDDDLKLEQRSEMKKYQDLRSDPDQSFTLDCNCTTCANYIWDTCGSNSWVKDSKCSYGNSRTLHGCL